MSKGVGYEGVISIHVLNEWQQDQITFVKTRKVHFCAWHMSCQSVHKIQFCGWLEKRVSEAMVTLQSLVGQHNLVYWKGTLQFKLAMLNWPTEAQMLPCHGSTVNSMNGLPKYLLVFALHDALQLESSTGRGKFRSPYWARKSRSASFSFVMPRERILHLYLKPPA